MLSHRLARIELNGHVFLAEDGDFFAEIVAMAIDSGGRLVAVDTKLSETHWESIENDAAHSILCSLDRTPALYADEKEVS